MPHWADCTIVAPLRRTVRQQPHSKELTMIWGRWGNTKSVRLVVGMLVLLILLIFSHADRAVAQENNEPVKCLVGAYLQSLQNLNIESHSFDADVWMWSDCPLNTAKPLDTADFV